MNKGHKKPPAPTALGGIVNGALIAVAAASWFTSVQAASPSAEEAIIHCAGVNGCKRPRPLWDGGAFLQRRERL